MPAHAHNNQESFNMVEDHRPGAKRCYSLDFKLKAIGEAKRSSKEKGVGGLLDVVCKITGKDRYHN